MGQPIDTTGMTTTTDPRSRGGARADPGMLLELEGPPPVADKSWQRKVAGAHPATPPITVHDAARRVLNRGYEEHGNQPPLRVIPLAVSASSASTAWSLERGDDAIAIDCGVMFPDAQLMGIDLVIPMSPTFASSATASRASWLTHGHEDHLARFRTCGRVRRAGLATRFTEGLLRERLGDHPRLAGKAIERFGDGDRFTLGASRSRASPSRTHRRRRRAGGAERRRDRHPQRRLQDRRDADRRPPVREPSAFARSVTKA